MKMLLGFGVLLVVCAGLGTAAQERPASACVKLVRSEPFQPDQSPLPKYPDDAKAAHVEGDVSFHLEVGSGCAVDEFTIDDGPKLLRGAVETAVKEWKFCGVPEGQEIRATIAFRLNCPAK
jgi:outer membrane biosynthesis protein TonB